MDNRLEDKSMIEMLEELELRVRYQAYLEEITSQLISFEEFCKRIEKENENE